MGEDTSKTPSPNISLSKAELRLEVGLEEKSFSLQVQARNLNAELMSAKEFSFEDRRHPSESPTVVEVHKDKIQELISEEKTRAWLVPVTIKHMPRNSAESRIIRVVVGNLARDLDYSVSNQPTTEFKWIIKVPPTPWVLFSEADARISIPISTGSQAVTDVRVTHHLVEDKTKRALPHDTFALCMEGAGCPTVRAGPNVTVDAQLVAKWPLPAGKYSGSIYLSTPEKSGPETIAFSVHVSSWYRYVIGVAMLIAGIWLGYVVSAWIPARQARLVALELVAPIQAALAHLDSDWAIVAGIGKEIRNKLAKLASSLEEGALDRDRLLPPLRPQLFPSNRSAQLQARLDEASKRLGIAKLVHDQGWLKVAGAAQSIERDDALSKLENLANEGSDKDSVALNVKQILDDFNKAARLINAPLLSPSIQLISERQIAHSYATLNKWGWMLWAALTVVGGFFMLMLDKTGFGLISDYLICFFWGLGLPAAADKVTPSAIQQTLRATTPKP